MCLNCVTNAEALAFNAVAGMGLVGGLVQRGRFRRARPAERLARELAKWEANAAFMRSLDLDPATVLGPPPSRSEGPLGPLASPELGEEAATGSIRQPVHH